MAILNIETATEVCSVALTDGGDVLFDRVSSEGQSHSALLGVYVDAAVKFAQEKGLEVEAVAVSSGPGSYTGLRIGVSMAKGLCVGWDVPLIAIPTLDIMASAAIGKSGHGTGKLFCAMIDARRMEVYSTIYDAQGQVVRGVQADVVDGGSYSELLAGRKVCFFGNGASKCKGVINSPQAEFMDDIDPLAAEMALLSERAFMERRFENVAYFEPFYFKEFMATTPKKKF